MAISKTIIGQKTLDDGRILKFGARDPTTGRRFELVEQAPKVAPTPKSKPFAGLTQKQQDLLDSSTRTLQETSKITGIPFKAPQRTSIGDTDITKTTKTPELPDPTASTINEAFITSLSSQVEKSRKALQDTFKQQREDIAKRQEISQKKIDELSTKQEDIITGDVERLLQPFRADLEKTERERLSVEKNFAENQKLVNELDTLLTEGNELIQQMKGVTGLSGIRNPRINQAIDSVNARVGVIQAVMSARSGQIGEAFRMIDRSVEATTADRNDQLSYYSTLLSFYDKQVDAEGKKLISLDKDDKTFLGAQINLLENDLKQAETTANFIKEAMINPETASIYGRAGVTLNDTIPEINQKLEDDAYSQEVISNNNAFREDGFKVVTAQQTVNLPEAEIVRITDSKGNETIYWKEAEVDDRELTIAESKSLNVPIGTLLSEVEGVTPSEDNLFTTLTGEEIDITTVEGIKRVQVLNPRPRAEWEALLDQETKLDKTSRKALLDEANIRDTQTKEEVIEKIKSKVQELKGLGFSRGEAQDALINAQKNINPAIKKIIKDQMVEVFGRTFLQKTLLGGR